VYARSVTRTLHPTRFTNNDRGLSPRLFWFSQVRTYVNQLAEAHPELADILADPSAEGDLLPSRASFPAVCTLRECRCDSRKLAHTSSLYRPAHPASQHLGATELETGLKAGTYLQGTFRSGAYSTREVGRTTALTKNPPCR